MYLLAAPLTTFAFGLLIYRYFFNKTIPEFIIKIISYSLGAPVQSLGNYLNKHFFLKVKFVFLKLFNIKFLVPPEKVILAMAIFTVHCWKRYYESYYVNIFSDVYMNFAIYLIGHGHYIGAIIGILGESKQFLSGIDLI